eukprot:gene15488-6739_t
MAMKELDAQSMNEAFFSKLEQMGLDYKGCLIGMGFDGASVTSGRLGGVQRYIIDKAPMAYYLHCYGQRLNLVLVETVKEMHPGEKEALSDFAVSDAIGKSATVSPEKPFHADIFLPILDCMLSELDRRLSCDAKEILREISALSPTCESFLEYQALKEIT